MMNHHRMYASPYLFIIIHVELLIYVITQVGSVIVYFIVLNLYIGVAGSVKTTMSTENESEVERGRLKKKKEILGEYYVFFF